MSWLKKRQYLRLHNFTMYHLLLRTIHLLMLDLVIYPVFPPHKDKELLGSQAHDTTLEPGPIPGLHSDPTTCDRRRGRGA